MPADKGFGPDAQGHVGAVGGACGAPRISRRRGQAGLAAARLAGFDGDMSFGTYTQRDPGRHAEGHNGHGEEECYETGRHQITTTLGNRRRQTKRSHFEFLRNSRGAISAGDVGLAILAPLSLVSHVAGKRAPCWYRGFLNLGIMLQAVSSRLPFSRGDFVAGVVDLGRVGP